MKRRVISVTTLSVVCLFLLSPVAGISVADNATGNEKKRYPLNERFRKTWPTAEDLKWFRASKGMSKNELLEEFGAPIKRDRKGKVTRWFYPWMAVSFITIENGVGTGYFYDAGY